MREAPCACVNAPGPTAVRITVACVPLCWCRHDNADTNGDADRQRSMRWRVQRGWCVVGMDPSCRFIVVAMVGVGARRV